MTVSRPEVYIWAKFKRTYHGLNNNLPFGQLSIGQTSIDWTTINWSTLIKISIGQLKIHQSVNLFWDRNKLFHIMNLTQKQGLVRNWTRKSEPEFTIEPRPTKPSLFLGPWSVHKTTSQPVRLKIGLLSGWPNDGLLIDYWRSSAI